MAFNHRRQLQCFDDKHDCLNPPQSPKNTRLLVILISCALVTAFIVVCYLTLVKKYYSNPNNLRRRNRNQPAFVVDDDDDHHHQEDFVDENQGPVVEHHIWYINTIGLQQSVIDSISVFKYKKNEGLIEGTDCSVCLSEFEEDETLRLLPKCSHAFHIPCIDTWLRSHKNCPLCRAPIVSEAILAQESAPEPNSNRLVMREDESLENFRELGEDGNLGNENCGGLPSEEVTNFENLMKNSGCFRVLSDLGDHRLKVEEEFQAVRRSVSMDDSSASRIYLAVANIPVEGCSSNRLVQGKKVNSEKVVKGVSENLRISGLMKSSSSLGCSLQKGSTSMKRSRSSSGLFSFSRRYTKSQDSILPL